MNWLTFYFAAGRDAKYCNQHVCLSVCLLTSQKLHVQILPYFLYTLPVAMARSSSDSRTRHGRPWVICQLQNQHHCACMS